MEKPNGTMEKNYGRKLSLWKFHLRRKKHGRFSKTMNFDLHWKKQW